MSTPNTFYTKISHINDLVDKIYTTENNRLQQKKKGIDEMIVSQKRLISLNQSYTSKMKKYGYMISIIAFALVLVVMIITFHSRLPSLLADLGIIIVMAGSIIWSYLIYVDIQNRDKIDFNELAIDSSSLVNPANIEQSNTTAGDTGDISSLVSNTAFSAGCIGSTCCDKPNWASVTANSQYYYNSNLKKCAISSGWVAGTKEPTA